jgi:uncharacterized protein (DUF58 family)
VPVIPARHQAEALAASLPPLLVAADRVAATVMQGVHGRRRTGIGESFWQFRPYSPTDSASRIDWRQSAKRDRAFVRENEWEAAQTVWLWVDGSPSMDWRSSPNLPTKAERARLLLLALGVLLARGGERLALLGGRPGHGRYAIARIAETFEHAAEPGDSLPRLVPLPRNAGLVLIGDLLSPLEEVAAVVGGFAAQGVRGHLLQVMDPAEETLPFEGRVRFEGLEHDPAALVSRVEAIRTAYDERLAAHRAGLAELAQRHRWSFGIHRTDHSASAALLVLYTTLADRPQYERGFR